MGGRRPYQLPDGFLARLPVRSGADQPRAAGTDSPALRRPPVRLQLGAGPDQGQLGCPSGRPGHSAAGMGLLRSAPRVEPDQAPGRTVVARVLEGGLRLRDRRPGHRPAHLVGFQARPRAGARVGFPRFKARRRDRGRVRFSTGVLRLEADRRHLTLPVIGRLRCKENTRRLERLLAKGQARVLSMTLSEHGGRLFVSVAHDHR
jgi:hypothetical protein